MKLSPPVGRPDRKWNNTSLDPYKGHMV